jgi:hypothetical protein
MMTDADADPVARSNSWKEMGSSGSIASSSQRLTQRVSKPLGVDAQGRKNADRPTAVVPEISHLPDH